MSEWLRKHAKIVIPVGVAGIAVVAYLAFGVFGLHTLFVDDVVDEAVPVFDSGLTGDAIDPATREEMDQAMADAGTSDDVVMDEDDPMPEAQDEASSEEEMEVFTVVSGEFVGRSHPAVGDALVLNDGSEQRFLRFENFETDNGPDLNVFLSAGATADGDAGLFDDDFVDLGDLKGNIGPQNYEIPVDVDLDRYRTVVIWCVRFGVAFGAADLS